MAASYRDLHATVQARDELAARESVAGVADEGAGDGYRRGRRQEPRVVDPGADRGRSPSPSRQQEVAVERAVLAKAGGDGDGDGVMEMVEVELAVAAMRKEVEAGEMAKAKHALRPHSKKRFLNLKFTRKSNCFALRAY
ncbi:hypothetical protein GUJ93_ZPchr0002g26700 [Zizania palustris]|uniref:Uncharacterized protein n=1 Tax=Zizania palustris TaxID=103762 RepID=A0A8J5RWD8_ZIZPA|nr:hypothetical protein GUJ93_ZPchr0002g26700 [Zizania palustris]